jgi:hypothetical protein
MEWGAQIALYFSYALLGWHGTIILASLAITITFASMYWLLARRLRATVALGATATSIVFAHSHFLARPHLLSFPIFVIWAAFLARACDDGRRPSYWLLPLMTLWANLHGAFTVGLVLAAGLGFEAVVCAPATDRLRIAIRWLAFVFCALAAACITPYGYRYALETYNVLNLGPVLQQNGEWRPMNAYNEFVQEAILLLLLILALASGARLRFPRVLLLVGILHFALKHVRGLAMLALLWPFLLAGPLQRQFAFLRPIPDVWPLFREKKTLRVGTIASVCTSIAVMIALSTVFVRVRPEMAPASDISPRAAVDYVVRQNITGPVLNDFDFGGYLISRGIKTFIDGRTLPFGREFAIEYFDALTLKNLPKLEAMADSHKVSWTLLRSGSAPAFYFDRSPRWQRIYADDIAVVHVRNR